MIAFTQASQYDCVWVCLHVWICVCASACWHNLKSLGKCCRLWAWSPVYSGSYSRMIHFIRWVCYCKMQECFQEHDFTQWAAEACYVFCCLLTLQVFSSFQHSGFKTAWRVQLPRFISFLLINILPCKTVERDLSLLSSGNTEKKPTWVIHKRQTTLPSLALLWNENSHHCLWYWTWCNQCIPGMCWAFLKGKLDILFSVWTSVSVCMGGRYWPLLLRQFWENKRSKTLGAWGGAWMSKGMDWQQLKTE